MSRHHSDAQAANLTDGPAPKAGKDHGFLKKVIQKVKGRRQSVPAESRAQPREPAPWEAAPAEAMAVPATPAPPPPPPPAAAAPAPPPVPSIPVPQDAFQAAPKTPERPGFKYPEQELKYDRRDSETYRSDACRDRESDRHPSGQGCGRPRDRDRDRDRDHEFTESLRDRDRDRDQGYRRYSRREYECEDYDRYSDYSDEDEQYAVPYRPCSAPGRRYADRERDYLRNLPQPPPRPPKMLPPENSRANAESGFHPRAAEKPYHPHADQRYGGGYGAAPPPAGYPPHLAGYGAQSPTYLHQAAPGYPAATAAAAASYGAQQAGFSAQPSNYASQANSGYTSPLNMYASHASHTGTYSAHTPGAQPAAAYPQASAYQGYPSQAAGYAQPDHPQHYEAAATAQPDQWYAAGMTSNFPQQYSSQPPAWASDVPQQQQQQQQPYSQAPANAKGTGAWGGADQAYNISMAQPGFETYRLNPSEQQMMGMFNNNNPDAMWGAAIDQRRRSMPTM